MSDDRHNYLVQNQVTKQWNGNILTAEYDIDFWLVAREDAAVGSNRPAFEVFTKSKRHGKTVKIGAVWEKQTGENEVFYSITIDEASMPRPLNVTAFASKDGPGFDIVWSRPKQKAAA